MHKKLVSEIDILIDCTDIEICFIINNLKTMLFLIDDEIIRQGDYGNRMFLISNGIVDVYLTTEKSKKDSKKKKRRGGNNDPMLDDFSENSKADHDEDDANAIVIQENRINRLKTGKYFGEIALITNLQRTATVKAADYTTLAYLTRESFMAIKHEFPQVYLNFKRNIRKYTDSDFEFRRSMIKNTPYFRNLDDEIIDELVYLLRPNRYDPGTVIIKFGDITGRIHYLKQGEIDVTIPMKNGLSQSEIKFETINAGS